MLWCHYLYAIMLLDVVVHCQVMITFHCIAYLMLINLPEQSGPNKSLMNNAINIETTGISYLGNEDLLIGDL